MAWIEVHQELRAHRKVRALQAALRIPRAQAVGHLIFLWLWAIDHASDGDLSQEDIAGIAEAAMWEGRPDEFWEALNKSGWVDSGPGCGTLHDWMHYASRLVIKRTAKKRERAEYYRNYRASVAAQPPQPSATIGCATTATTPQPVVAQPRNHVQPRPTVPYLTEPNTQTVPPLAETAPLPAAAVSLSAPDGDPGFPDGPASTVMEAEASKAVDPLQEQALEVIRSFREDYRDNVDAAYRFKPHIPEADIKAAKSFLRSTDWPFARMQNLKQHVMLDVRPVRHGTRDFPGYATQVRCFSKLWDQRDDLEARLVRGK